MKAQELRIGNYVNLIAEGHEDEPDTFKWDIDDYIFYEDRMHFIIPIPLTTEVMFKYTKFEPVSDCIYELYNLQIDLEDRIAYLRLDGNEGVEYLTEITYLHQLQNLYFELNNEELC